MDSINTELKNLLYAGEVAKYIPGFDKYIVTSKGRVFSAKKESVYVTLKGKRYEATMYKELKPFYVRGYKAVCLSNTDVFGKNERKNYYIHELVMIAFMGQYNKSYLKIVHINKKKSDNRLENLKLEFRKKDEAFIAKYKQQQRILAVLDN